jgi:hypothetical protein
MMRTLSFIIGNGQLVEAFQMEFQLGIGDLSSSTYPSLCMRVSSRLENQLVLGQFIFLMGKRFKQIILMV